MDYLIITTDDIIQNVINLKAKKAAGPDKKTLWIYKAIGKVDVCRDFKKLLPKDYR